MTLIDVHQPVGRPPAEARYARTYGRRGPAPIRPAASGVTFRGTGIPMSRAPHRRRPVSAATTVALAAVAALVTLWLGAILHARTSSGVPDTLAVVRVQPGESLQHLAARVAPGAPVSRVAERIRELNDLDSAALDAGEALVVPVG